MSKHTPGPWAFDGKGPFTCGGDEASIDAVTEDGKMVRREICTLMIDTGDGDEDADSMQEDLANGRLIAASPLMLQAIVAAKQAVADLIRRPMGVVPDSATMAIYLIDTAIDLAEGRDH